MAVNRNKLAYFEGRTCRRSGRYLEARILLGQSAALDSEAQRRGKAAAGSTR